MHFAHPVILMFLLRVAIICFHHVDRKQFQEEKGLFEFRSVSDPSLFEVYVLYSLSISRALLILEYCVISCPPDLVLPDVSYQVESSEGDQSQNMDSQGQTLLLFLFVDFHSEFPVQQTELWSRYRGCQFGCALMLRE